MSELVSRRYNNLDGLRAFAAICIVLYHVSVSGAFKFEGEFSTYLFKSVVREFSEFAKLFFVISGFAICCGYYEKFKSGHVDLKRFYGGRYLRILPFLALMTGIDLVVALIMYGTLDKTILYEAFANLTLMFGFFAGDGMSVIGVGWTIGVIFGFYILFPFFVYLIWNKRRAWLSLAVMLCITYVNEAFFEVGRNTVFPWLCYFIVGGLLYLYREALSRWLRHPAVGTAISLCGFALVIFLPLSERGIQWTMLCTLKNLFAFSMITAGMLSRDNPVWYNPVMRFLSNISLEIYLSHMMFWRAAELIGLPDGTGAGALGYFICAVVVLGATILFAWLYKCFEGWTFKKIKAISNKVAAKQEADDQINIS